MSEERAFWFTWNQIQGMGPILQKRLAHEFSTLAAAWRASFNELQRVEGIGSKLAQEIVQQRAQLNPDDAYKQKTPFITPADEGYPSLLYEIPDPPPVLYYRGQLDLLTACQFDPGIGIVGTRSPSEYGKRWTRRLTVALSRAGFLIISGLAAGIDREAHHSCLNANGRTIAVLGTGVDIVYPYRNHDIHQAIAQSGLLISEYPPGTQPDRVHFPRRNRVIAGLSRAILVTEAPARSGALITANLANDYGRDVFALPGNLDNPSCRGALALVNQGAHLILDEQNLLDTLGRIPVENAAIKNSPIANPPVDSPQLMLTPADLDPQLSQVLETIPAEAKSLDAIVQQSGELSTGAVLSALVQLELMGLVTQLPGMQYQRCDNLT